MTQRVQQWILRNGTGLKYIVNERLATRSGLIGRIFKGLEIGERVYGQHAFHRLLRVVNYYWVMVYHTLGIMRPVFSRFIGVQQGPLNYTGLWLWISITVLVLNRFRFIRIRDTLMLNAQDNPEFWFARYNMMFPPSFLHNRLSAHYIEINHIFAIEMMKKYIKARKDIL